jgi:hypothetical protein
MNAPKVGKMHPCIAEAMTPNTTLIQGVLYGASLLKKLFLEISANSSFSLSSNSLSFSSASSIFFFSNSTTSGSFTFFPAAVKGSMRCLIDGL